MIFQHSLSNLPELELVILFNLLQYLTTYLKDSLVKLSKEELQLFKHILS